MADQANQDPSWPPGHLTGLQLINLIIDALYDNSLEWPMNFGYLTKSQWINCMKQNPTFYMQPINDPSVSQAHERLLLYLASKLLKRKICLISLFPEDKDETFEPPMPTSLRSYYLLGCNKANSYNFYVSIFKDKSNDPETIATNLSSLQIDEGIRRTLIDTNQKIQEFSKAHRKLKNETEDGTEDGNLKSPIMQDSSTQTDDSFIPTKNSATQTQDSSLQINEGVDPNQTKTNYDNFHDSIFEESSLKLSVKELIRRFEKK